MEYAPYAGELDDPTAAPVHYAPYDGSLDDPAAPVQYAPYSGVLDGQNAANGVGFATTIGKNLLDGARENLVKLPAAVATAAGNAFDAMGADRVADALHDTADDYDNDANAWAKDALQNGGDTVLGKVSNIIGSIAPVLALPEAKLVQWTANAGLFAMPAFRESLQSNLDAGHGYADALTHAVAAFGVNMLLPAAMEKLSGTTARALGLAEADGTGNTLVNAFGARGAATQLGMAGAEGAGFSLANSVIDKSIDSAYGEQNANPWVDPKDMLANALAFAALRGRAAARQWSGAAGVDQIADAINGVNPDMGDVEVQALAALHPNYPNEIDSSANGNPGAPFPPDDPMAEADAVQDTPTVAAAAEQADALADAPLTAREADVAQRFQDRIDADPQGMIDQYFARNGNLIDPDKVKEMSEDYMADPSLANAVHEPSSSLSKAIFTEALARNPGAPVTFTAGGGGSGKSETLEKAQPLTKLGEGGIVFDSTLSSFGSATQKIDQALSAGHQVRILYTNRSAPDAFGFALARARVVKISDLAEKHVGASNAIRDLIEHYKNNPNVDIRILNNNGGKEDIRAGSIADVPVYDYNELIGEFHEQANAAYAEGRISKERLADLRGRSDEASDREPPHGADAGGDSANARGGSAGKNGFVPQTSQKITGSESAGVGLNPEKLLFSDQVTRRGGFFVSGSNSAKHAGAPVEFTGQELGGPNQPMPQLRRKALEYAKARFAGRIVTNESDGSQIELARQGIKHGLSGFVRPIEAMAATKLDELVRKGEFVGSAPDSERRRDIKAFHYYNTPVRIGGENKTIRVVVRETDSGNRLYDHSELIDPAAGGTSESSPVDIAHQSSPAASGFKDGEPASRVAQDFVSTEAQHGVENADAWRNVYRADSPGQVNAADQATRRGGLFISEVDNAKRAVAPVEFTGQELGGPNQPIKQLVMKATVYAKEKFGGKIVKNESDGSNIELSRRGIKHGLSAKVTPTEAMALTKLDELVCKGQYAGSAPDTEGRPSIKAFHYYDTLIRMGGENKAIRVVVRETDMGRKFYDHYEIVNKAAGGMSEDRPTSKSIQPSPAATGPMDGKPVISVAQDSFANGASIVGKDAGAWRNVQPQDSLGKTQESNQATRHGGLSVAGVDNAKRTVAPIESLSPAVGGMSEERPTSESIQPTPTASGPEGGKPTVSVSQGPFAETRPSMDNDPDAWRNVHRDDSPGQVNAADQATRRGGLSVSGVDDRSAPQDTQFSHESPIKSVDANIRRGNAALDRALLYRTSVHRAMYRSDLGWVDFVWGSEGRVQSSGKTVGAMGLSHIIEARMRKDNLSYADAIGLLRRIVETVARGETKRYTEYPNSKRVTIAYGSHEAVLVRISGENAWVLNGWESHPGAKRAAFSHPDATHPKADLSDQGMGAGYDDNVARELFQEQAQHYGNDTGVRLSAEDEKRPDGQSAGRATDLPTNIAASLTRSGTGAGHLETISQEGGDSPRQSPRADKAQAPFPPVPRPLSSKQKYEQSVNVAALNRALEKQGEEPVRPLFKAPTANHALAQEVSKLFGVRVQFVTDNPTFEGVTHKGIAYLTEHMAHPVLALAGHEASHVLERENPAAAQALLNYMQLYLRDGVIAHRRQWEESFTASPISEDYATREVLADLHGAMWLDPQYWRELAQYDLRLFRQLAYHFMAVTTKAVQALAGSRFDASALVTDLNAVRTLIAKTWAEHNQGRDAAERSGGIRAEKKESAAVSVRDYPATMNAERIVPTLDPNARGDGKDGLIVGDGQEKNNEGNVQSSRVMPDAIIGNPLGELSHHPDYTEAKRGDESAAFNIARDVVTPEFVERIRNEIGERKPIIQPVIAKESTGKNKIPLFAATKIAQVLRLPMENEIVQSSNPKRTILPGMDRIFNRPEFDGKVEKGRKYFLIDDTITQGGTFAALKEYIERHGGEVIGSAALTGKQYSARLALSDATSGKLHEKYGDIEPAFRAATGRGYDSLTESEARYLANFKPADTVRNRILAEGKPGSGQAGNGDVQRSGKLVQLDTGRGRSSAEGSPGNDQEGKGSTQKRFGPADAVRVRIHDEGKSGNDQVGNGDVQRSGKPVQLDTGRGRSPAEGGAGNDQKGKGGTQKFFGPADAVRDQGFARGYAEDHTKPEGKIRQGIKPPPSQAQTPEQATQRGGLFHSGPDDLQFSRRGVAGKAGRNADSVDSGEDRRQASFPADEPPLSSEQRRRQRANVETLNRALEKQGVAPVQPLFEVPTAEHALARAVGKVFGTQVQFVTDSPIFNGVAYDGIAYLARSMEWPVLAVAGHEVYHTLEQTNPQVAGALLAYVKSYFRDGVVEQRRQQEQQSRGAAFSEHEASREVLADLNGAMWLDPKFWREMARRDANLFRHVAYRFMELSSRAVKALTGTGFDAHALVTDADAVRALIADAWVEHLTQGDGLDGGADPGTSAASDDELAYRRRDVQRILGRRPITKLYRGDPRPLETVFKEGFAPRGDAADLEMHALLGGASIFVPTSKLQKVARDYGRGFPQREDGGYVYTIRVQPHGVDVNAALGVDSPKPDEHEVAVPHGIAPGDILGAQRVDRHGNFVGPFIRNPRYNFRAP